MFGSLGGSRTPDPPLLEGAGGGPPPRPPAKGELRKVNDYPKLCRPKSIWDRNFKAWKLRMAAFPDKSKVWGKFRPGPGGPDAVLQRERY